MSVKTERGKVVRVLRMARDLLKDGARWASGPSNLDVQNVHVGLQERNAVKFTMEGALYRAQQHLKLHRAYALSARVVVLRVLQRPRSINKVFGKKSVTPEELITWYNTNCSHGDVFATLDRAATYAWEDKDTSWLPPRRTIKPRVKKK